MLNSEVFDTEVRMNTPVTLIALLVLSLSSTLAVAGKIYKWVDEQGNTHYSQQPPDGRATQLNIRSAPSRPAPPPSTGNRKEKTKELLDAIATERKQKAEARNKADKEAARLKTNCSNARKRVASLEMGGRRYDVTEDGERKYLDDAEVKRRLDAARQQVAKWCNK